MERRESKRAVPSPGAEVLSDREPEAGDEGAEVSIRVILWDVSRSSNQQSTQQRRVPSLSCARFPAASLSVPQVKVALSRLALEPKPTTN